MATYTGLQFFRGHSVVYSVPSPWPHYPNVFSECRNLLYNTSVSFSCDGSLFHSPGQAAADAQSPKVLYVHDACLARCGM